MIVGRDRSNVMRMIITMRVARDGSSMVMKDSFSSVTLVEGNAHDHEERVGEMESCGMEALLRAVASSLSISVGFDKWGVELYVTVGGLFCSIDGC